MTGPDLGASQRCLDHEFDERLATVPPAAVSGDTAVLRPRGEFDLANRRELDTAIHDAVISGYGQVIVDLSEVTFIDASVIHTLLRNQRLAESRGRRLNLVNAAATAALILRALHIGLPLWDGTEQSDG
ncbi:MAG TPA: STAS domain-containing protein [Candidatus Limnocylindrales bacterium]|nr:STAS domain-containing protein [Candidatus Limnocylindrales bacterium]